MVPLGFLFTWLWGVLGMALAFLCSVSITAMYLLMVNKKLLKCSRLSEFFPWQRLLLILVIALVSVMLVDGVFGNWLGIQDEMRMLMLAWKLCGIFVLSLPVYGLLLFPFGLRFF
jgi:hypothetical protein